MHSVRATHRLTGALITAAAFMIAGAVCVPAWGQTETEVRPREAVRAGTAPRLEVLMENVADVVPTGISREVLNIPVLPELLKRNRVTTDKDPLTGDNTAKRAPSALLSFGGFDNQDNQAVIGFQVAPPDTEGDVGLDYFVQYNNLGFSIFRKTDGALIFGPAPGNVFWQGFGGVCESDNAGDPIVLFDHIAQQWVFSQFTNFGNPDGHQCFAISTGSDPHGPYFLYDFTVSIGQFNDFPKITVWTDGAGQSAYHMSTNEFLGFDFTGVNATAFERDAMLSGAPAQFVQTTLPSTIIPSVASILPAHLEGPAPPAGTCNHYVLAVDDEAYGTGTEPDGYQFWRYCVNWNDLSASTFTSAPLIKTAEFDAELCGFDPNCIPQAGTDVGLDAVGQVTMYRFQNRFFPGQGLRGVVNHTVDAGGNRAGIRWAEFTIPNDLAAISIDDTGTYAPDDHQNRWMGSIAMDQDGNLGLAYSRSNASSFPGIFFTGRETSDPAGTMQGESTCVAGSGAQTGFNRWGDYSSISVDPVDGCTFWLTNAFVETTGPVNWDTRICSFRFPSCSAGGGDVAFASGTAIGDQSSGAGSNFRTVSFGETLSNPIVVMGPPSFNGTQPTAVRVRNVTSTHFQYQIEEWDYLDGFHFSENIGYLAVEAGSGSLGGLAVEADAVDINDAWTTVSFGSTFGQAPVVVAQTVTRNGGQAVTTRVRNVTSSSFEVRLQEEEGNDGSHAVETVHWIALEPGNGYADGVTVRAGRTDNTVTNRFATISFGGAVSSTVFLADMQTFDGSDTTALRHRNLTTNKVEVKCEEEKSNDTEVGHTTEVIGWIAIEDD